jgi:hypothetical protein
MPSMPLIFRFLPVEVLTRKIVGKYTDAIGTRGASGFQTGCSTPIEILSSQAVGWIAAACTAEGSALTTVRESIVFS